MIVYFLILNCFIFWPAIAIDDYIKDACELTPNPQQSKNLNQNNTSENKKLTKEEEKWISDNLMPLQVYSYQDLIKSSIPHNDELKTNVYSAGNLGSEKSSCTLTYTPILFSDRRTNFLPEVGFTKSLLENEQSKKQALKEPNYIFFENTYKEWKKNKKLKKKQKRKVFNLFNEKDSWLNGFGTSTHTRKGKTTPTNKQDKDQSKS